LREVHLEQIKREEIRMNTSSGDDESERVVARAAAALRVDIETPVTARISNLRERILNAAEDARSRRPAVFEFEKPCTTCSGHPCHLSNWARIQGKRLIRARIISHTPKLYLPSL
jgi:hypothetical protein